MHRIILPHSMLAFLLLTILYQANAQTLNMDSLRQRLHYASEDTNKVLLLHRIADEYSYNQMDSATYYYRMARNLSEKLGYKRGLILYMRDRQHLMNIQGQYDSALILCLRAAELSREIGDDYLLASALGNLGSVHLYIGDKEKAIDYYLQSADLLEKLGDKRRLAILYTNLGINYQRLKQHANALAYGEKAIELTRQLGSKGDLGIALSNHAVTLIDMNRRKEALPLLEEALKISRETNYTRLQLSVLINMAGTLEEERTDRQKFKVYIDEALRLSRQMDEKTGLAISLRCLGDYYFHEGDLTNAREYTLQSLQVTREFENPEDEVKALTLLSYIAAVQGDLEAYGSYRMQSDTLRSRLVNQDMARNIKDLEVKYETRKKEDQIVQLQQLGQLQALTIRQKNIMNGILTGVVLIIMVTGGLFYRNYRQRQLLQQQTIRELQTERQLLATDAVLQGQEDERSRLARDLHDGLGGILSGAKFTFDAMKDNMIMTAENQKAFSRGMDLLETSIRELRRVAHNMMPESLVRTGLPQAVRDLCADYQQHHVNIIYQEYGLDDVQFKQSVSITVYRIIQELLNNALRHAQASAIIVQLSYHNNLLQLTVEDNGKGFPKQQTSPSRGMGWANIRSRVEYLNGTIDMNSSEGKGTSVTITLPL